MLAYIVNIRQAAGECSRKNDECRMQKADIVKG
jgi:hypothetical protein